MKGDAALACPSALRARLLLRVTQGWSTLQAFFIFPPRGQRLLVKVKSEKGKEKAGRWTRKAPGTDPEALAPRGGSWERAVARRLALALACHAKPGVSIGGFSRLKVVYCGLFPG